MQGEFAVGYVEFLHAVEATFAHSGDCAESGSGVIGNQATKHCFGNTTGDTEDNAGAGNSAEGHIYSFGLNFPEYDTGFGNHADKFLCGDNCIHIGHTVTSEFFAVCFEFLCGTGHNSYVEHLLFIVLGSFLEGSCEHLHGRLAGRDVFHQLGMLLFCVTNPCRAAGSKQRELAAFFYAF